MGRSILAVILGYLTLAIIVTVTLAVAYVLLGTEGAFQEGSYGITGTWIGISFALGLIAAILGGWICARIAPRPRPLVALVVVILVLGAVTAAVGWGTGEDPGPRASDAGVLEAMQNARPPTWIAFVNPVIGVIGVLLGGRRAMRSEVA
ncbi:MAG: hypothetical protein O7B99_10025 [Planctomycetota bacterium]|nr:hypothetical protein [Planctomycetota bacterium]